MAKRLNVNSLPFAAIRLLRAGLTTLPIAEPYFVLA